MEHLILVVNPGSTSTKIAVYEGRKQIFLKKIRHLQEILQQFDKIADQFEFRKNTIDDELSKAGINIKDISIVVGRGGLLKPIAGGVYIIHVKSASGEKIIKWFGGLRTPDLNVF